MDKELLKSLLIYMDLSILDKHGTITQQGILAKMSLEKGHSEFMNDKKRHDLICSFLEELK